VLSLADALGGNRGLVLASKLVVSLIKERIRCLRSVTQQYALLVGVQTVHLLVAFVPDFTGFMIS
jgi:hypothetical protein